MKDFSAKVDGHIKQETDAWINEFRSNIAELEKVLKTGADERKPKLAIFEDYEIRREDDEKTESWYFSVVDILPLVDRDCQRD